MEDARIIGFLVLGNAVARGNDRDVSSSAGEDSRCIRIGSELIKHRRRAGAGVVSRLGSIESASKGD